LYGILEYRTVLERILFFISRDDQYFCIYVGKKIRHCGDPSFNMEGLREKGGKKSRSGEESSLRVNE